MGGAYALSRKLSAARIREQNRVDNLEDIVQASEQISTRQRRDYSTYGLLYVAAMYGIG